MRKNIFKTIVAGMAALVGLTGSVDAMAASPARTSVTHPEWSRNAVIYEVNLRQYTPEGSINAFIKELPRLKDLGVKQLSRSGENVARRGTCAELFAMRQSAHRR